ncbi:stage III sporulation protein AG [Bacillus sp. B-jedd]|uniref:stage III sporulation protein AG n=1 Tax=Bacillus sp. B-jedd TaxID=1476857 RepID=UPI003FA4242C
MKGKIGVLEWLRSTFSGGEPEKKKHRYQYMALVLCIGAVFMLVGNIFLPEKKGEVVPTAAQLEGGGEEVPVFGQKKSAKKATVENYERTYENQLKEALEDMLGVDDVTVVVNVESTESKVLEKNRVTKRQTTVEKDPEGGTRNVEDASVDEQLVIIRSGEKEEPIVIETKKPEIRGVLVVARGADNIEVKKWIIEAVTRSLGVPSHRVAVMAKKTKGDS